MDFKGEHILSTKQFDKEGMLRLFKEASEMEEVIKAGGNDLLKGKILASLFFEPSTRTRFSFEVAMLRLGGKVVSNPDMKNNSSLKKMETLYDTAKCVSQMVDVIAVRHPESGKVAELAKGSDVPVLNAGDGASEHPTQALLDLYTIWKKFGQIDGVTVGMLGDLKNSRVQHSQCGLLKHFDVKLVFCSPKSLEMPDGVAENEFEEVDSMDELLPQVDVLSVSRVQIERFENMEEYEKCAGTYVVNASVMHKVKDSAIVIQPLPRVDEVAVEVDGDHRAKYFEQVSNGVAIRMALLKLIFNG
jgi:aspartate carbamoyltransferase